MAVENEAFIGFSPGEILRALGERLRRVRLSRGLTQQELAVRAGVSLSTLKLLERQGKGSLQRLVRVALVLGAAADFGDLFREPGAESIEAVKRRERQRAPRRAGRRMT